VASGWTSPQVRNGKDRTAGDEEARTRPAVEANVGRRSRRTRRAILRYMGCRRATARTSYAVGKYMCNISEY
jgi:hypothetical protein